MPADNVDDPALEALEQLIAALEQCRDDARRLSDEISHVCELREAGAAWSELLRRDEPGSRPKIITSLRTLSNGLERAGVRVRRAQAQALQREGLSDRQIAEIFDVSRQRISALLSGSTSGLRPE